MQARPDPTSVPARAAALILDAFLDYNARFSDITRRAKRWFERRSWRQAQIDLVWRLDLYEECLAETLGRLELLLDDRVRSRPLWRQIRDAFDHQVAPLLDRELSKTFFNSLSRRFFHTTGVAADIEFVALDSDPTAHVVRAVERTPYPLGTEPAHAVERVFADFPFACGYADAAADAAAVLDALAAQLDALDCGAATAIELLPTPFFRERRAYLVGRAFGERAGTPLVIALVSTAEGIRADAVLTDAARISMLFGFTRSYFLADLPTIADTIVYLHGLMPHKPIEELYTVLGRAKQGKTERYRHLFRHLAAHPAERLVRADGERGMVMAVFTPRDYPLVFKVIRDRFAYPKDIGRRQVEEKYRLVFRYDRIGRLVDAQEFRHLRFPLDQFDPPMLDELLRECAETVTTDGDDLVVAHCYVERRLRPLNLYAREAEPAAALQAVLDYGQAIKDLARSNIFPGDLLLKNFGITRGGRAIFYDYDELCLVESCRFRALPDARDEDETRPLEDWLTVRENDVFPEQFPRFLGIPAELRAALIATHGEIFDPRWWQAVQAGLAAGDYADVPPYPPSARLAALPA
ncbi:bifunctional isocitrate dehydrogenase kinase/phosphatase [Dokdonella koreensis]|uniref:Isocitrate dehydrogenase kinase/phosphatase n=1 Tax=Dokdonella koreensis DS-123 TaxID=1300342 RepID=A0A167H7B5_9GAMM|nr:bifunctional isocitrate dehydrogenase kinase/phosphatase [Dokdonella koreensis]ANB19292.1 bifunctional isocitrate dehydrogenase kinase/phosphatase protein [Dokdonella koreensis DS-123]